MVLHLCAVYVLGFEPFSFVLLENKTKQSAMFFWATLTIYMRDQWNKMHKQTKFRNRKKQSLRNRIEGTHKKGGNGNLYYAFPSHVKWISHNFHDSMEEACMQDKKKPLEWIWFDGKLFIVLPQPKPMWNFQRNWVHVVWTMCKFLNFRSHPPW